MSPSPVVLHKLSELYDLPYATVIGTAGYPVPQNVKSGTEKAARSANRKNNS